MTLEEEILQAANLLGTPKNISDYVKLTIRSRFCCSSCCPNAWHSLKEYLSPWGNIDERKMIRVDKSGTSYTYEHHETGAEIIVYIALGTALLSLTKSIVDLIVVISNGMKKDPKTADSETRIILNNGEIKRIIFAGWFTQSNGEREEIQVVIHEALKAMLEMRNKSKQVFLDSVVLFRLDAPHAKSVKLAGNFNGWDEKDMNRRPDGIWFSSIALKSGRYEYKFIVDGCWKTDPYGINKQDHQGNWNSVVDVD